MAKAEFSLQEMIEAAPQGREWLDGLSKSLGQTGHKDVLEKLSAVTDDGLVIAPIYPLTHPHKQTVTLAARADKAWKTLTRIDHPSAIEANAQLLHDLEQGADGALLVLAGSNSAHGFGIDLPDLSSFKALFGNIFVDATSIRFDGMSAAQCDLWTEFCSARGYDHNALNISINGQGTKDLKGVSANLIADASKWHNKGATAAQELGLALAETVSVIRELCAGGTDINPASKRLSVTLSSDADQFESMAKFRAMRLLWRKLLQTMNADETPLSLHATTSWRMMGRRDPWTNVLRTTMATFAAGLGGADSISVLPHTQALGLPDVFSRRVARNISLILQEESHLGKIVDPASGAGVYDALTVSLAEAAWVNFQTIEAQGGFTAAIENGSVQQMISASRQAYMKDIATRKTVSLGNSHFAQLDAPEVSTLITRPLEPEDQDESFGDLRDGILFERLADRAQNLSVLSQPAVLLLCLGNRKAWKARSDFATDLFAASGLAVENQEIGADAKVDKLDTERTPVICLCGADADYDANAEALVASLREAGARHILLAGRSDLSGLDDMIFIGCDAHAVLDRVLLALEGSKS
ncbi:methylmalonyl-CoA mutase family protein [Pararhizobium sp. IMCC21322]|uniref:methylmalonyl-CoA mutase family protein n=1 Tax=Pararhizobium sp. IMCC21322 TaxID=3067903 RepID=UPI002740B297|nr:methylmalonyl-CoA mutase family protein [Pararhizobium sp. IMCC21322]